MHGEEELFLHESHACIQIMEYYNKASKCMFCLIIMMCVHAQSIYTVNMYHMHTLFYN